MIPAASIDGVRRSAPAQTVTIEVVPEPLSGSGLVRTGEPVTVGMPFPRGWCPPTEELQLADSAGRRLLLQQQVLDRWPDGSARWVLLDFQTGEVDGPARYELARRSDGQASPEFVQGLACTEQGGQIIVDTGAARFHLGSHGRFPFEQVLVDGHDAIDADATRLEVCDASGQTWEVRITSARVAELGPVRARVDLHGALCRKGNRPLVELFAQAHFFTGSPVVRLALTLRNPRKADHPGGYWELGAGGAVFLKDVTMRVVFPRGTDMAHARCSPDAETPFMTSHEAIELYQDSSGGENWSSSNHLNCDRTVPLRFRGYRLVCDGAETTGGRATPILHMTGGHCTIAAAVPYFWENFPKSLESSADGLSLRLWPRQFGDAHELQGGEQKTHSFFVAFGPDPVTADPLAWCRRPLRARADPLWYCAAGAVPYIVPTAGTTQPGYQRLVDSAIEGESRFPLKREIIDEFGWRHFGDIYGDHEAVRKTTPPPLVSHYNNQYDAIAGFACQFLRSGDLRWWVQMDELARHVVDIDIYHTTRDKAAYNGGLFWHTNHYFDADGATHRTYARAHGSGGGGPSSEHNYTTGLMLHYFLTGDSASRDAAIGLARWVVDMDDGRRTVFRWFSRGDTGIVTASGSLHYHGPGRAGANSIGALVDGFQLTGDVKLLEKAEALIRRCVHPADDLAQRDLLDVERKWFYTMFFQVLGRYLQFKAECGSFDYMYAYARESLLHYARWMLKNERPYLERPEILEYPTESWAAHDMRKSEVFDFAAIVANEDERSAFQARAAFFFDYSTSTLARMPTRTLARPVVIMTTTGFRHECFLRNPQLRLPASGPLDFGHPERFVPQKTVALQRLRRLTVLLATLAAGLITWLLL